MNILFLINTGKNFDHFFFNLRNDFSNYGDHSFHFAFDSSYTLQKSDFGFEHDKCYVFSDYFANSVLDPEILLKYSKYNLNSALLSDFDRALEYNISRKDPEYYNNLKSSLLHFYHYIFESNRIDLVISESISNSFSYYAYFACKTFDIRFYSIGYSRLPNHFIIGDDPLSREPLKMVFNDIISGRLIPPQEVSNYVDSYFENFNKIEPDYMSSNGLRNLSFIGKYLNSKTVKDILFSIKYLFRETYFFHEMGNPLIHYFNLYKRSFFRVLKTKLLSRYYSSLDFDEKFLLYPLHLHPEASTSILAGTFLNEYEVIRNIVFNLPEGVTLYVKDHQSAWGFPEMKFYQNLKKLPNCKLISPFEDTKSLIMNSLGVITLTSTMGYEALLLGTRVFLFGETFYSIHKNVIKIDNPSKLFEIFQNSLGKDFNTDLDYNKKFVTAYYMCGFPGKLNMMLDGEPSKQIVNDISLSIYNHIKLL